MLTGGCHCGAVRYEVRGPVFAPNLCHCDICRGTTGAPCVAWFSVHPTAFVIAAGDPVEYRSTPTARRSFCGRCGTQLTFSADIYSGTRIDVTSGSLDDPEATPPDEEIWAHRKLAWMRRLDDLPDDSHRWPDGFPPR